MPVIVVTRLRLKSPAVLDEFFTDAVAAIEQAQQAAGNLGVDALAVLSRRRSRRRQRKPQDPMPVRT